MLKVPLASRQEPIHYRFPELVYGSTSSLKAKRQKAKKGPLPFICTQNAKREEFEVDQLSASFQAHAVQYHGTDVSLEIVQLRGASV
jgi:hypothetical protein